MWLQTLTDGWVNLAFVGSIRRLRDGAARLIGPDGRTLGTVGEYMDFEEGLDGQLVPAAAGQEAMIVTWWADPDGPGVDINRASVIGWRVFPDVALPVIAGDKATSNQSVLVLQPDGRICDPFNREWPTAEGVRAYFMEIAQAEWERKQRPAADVALMGVDHD